jgi:prevent-host-death family protein
LAVSDISVTEFRRNLQSCLARVRRGSRLRITSRGEVIAIVAPPTPSTSESDAARARLRGTVLNYADPLEPVFAPEEWDLNR